MTDKAPSGPRDGDACPVREEIYRVATRLRLNVLVVSKWFTTNPAARNVERASSSAKTPLVLRTEDFDPFAESWLLLGVCPL